MAFASCGELKHERRLKHTLGVERAWGAGGDISVGNGNSVVHLVCNISGSFKGVSGLGWREKDAGLSDGLEETLRS